MPDSVVVRCGLSGCVEPFQVLVQRLPALENTYVCKSCSSKDGEPVRQPCRAFAMEDGRVLRSYDIRDMHRQAKKLNAAASGDKQDMRLSSQTSRILHALEEQKLRRIQVPAARARAWQASSVWLTVRLSYADTGEAAVGRAE